MGAWLLLVSWLSLFPDAWNVIWEAAASPIQVARQQSQPLPEETSRGAADVRTNVIINRDPSLVLDTYRGDAPIACLVAPQ